MDERIIILIDIFCHLQSEYISSVFSVWISFRDSVFPSVDESCALYYLSPKAAQSGQVVRAGEKADVIVRSLAHTPGIGVSIVS